MLTAAGTLDDRVTGLDLGADDYLAQALRLRRAARAPARPRPAHPGGVGDRDRGRGGAVDTVRRIAERDGRPLRLTEGRGAGEPGGRPGGWVAAEELLEEVWEHGEERGRGVVKAAVHTLRRKLGPPDVVESSAGLGYRVEAEP